MVKFVSAQEKYVKVCARISIHFSSQCLGLVPGTERNTQVLFTLARAWAQCFGTECERHHIEIKKFDGTKIAPALSVFVVNATQINQKKNRQRILFACYNSNEKLFFLHNHRSPPA